MKKFKPLTIFTMLGIFLFLGGCQKEEQNEMTRNIDVPFTELSKIYFSDSASVFCNFIDSIESKFRISRMQQDKIALIQFLYEIDNSRTFFLNDEFISMYGIPEPKICLFKNQTGQNLMILPVVKNKSISAFFTILEKEKNIYQYTFTDRLIHNYYLERSDLRHRPDQAVLEYNDFYFRLFDFAICASDISPLQPSQPDNAESGICWTTITVLERWPCLALNTEITLRSDECETWIIREELTIVYECNNSGGGGAGTGDTGAPGYGGPGTGIGSSNNTGWSSLSSVRAVALSKLNLLNNWLRPYQLKQLYQLIKETDSDQCLKITGQLLGFLESNNFSQASIETVNCAIRNLNVTVHPSAPDNCTFAPPIPSLLNSITNLPSSAFSLFNQNFDFPCKLATSTLSNNQINQLINAVNNYLNDYSPILTDADGNQIINNNLPTRQEIANFLVDLLIKYPQLNLGPNELEWLLNNFAKIQYIQNYLSSSQTNVSLESRIQATQVYIKLHVSNPSFQELDDIWPQIPAFVWPFIKDIGAELGAELFKTLAKKYTPAGQVENVIDAIKALGQGELLVFIGEVFDIIKTKFPAAAFVEAGIESYDLYKRAEPVWIAISKMEKFGGDVIEKILTAIKGTGGNILDKFKWKNNSVGAELFNVGVAETFWDNIENSFSSLPGFTLLQPLELAQYEIAGFKINNGVIRISIKYGGNTNPNGHTIELKYANNPPFKIRII